MHVPWVHPSAVRHIDHTIKVTRVCSVGFTSTRDILGRTKLTEMSGTDIGIVPYLPKCRVPVSSISALYISMMEHKVVLEGSHRLESDVNIKQGLFSWPEKCLVPVYCMGADHRNFISIERCCCDSDGSWGKAPGWTLPAGKPVLSRAKPSKRFVSIRCL